MILSTNIGERNTWQLPNDSLQESCPGKTPSGYQAFLAMIIGWDSCKNYWPRKCLVIAKHFSCQ
jgi:hypothetical protein